MTSRRDTHYRESHETPQNQQNQLKDGKAKHWVTMNQEQYEQELAAQNSRSTQTHSKEINKITLALDKIAIKMDTNTNNNDFNIKDMPKTIKNYIKSSHNIKAANAILWNELEECRHSIKINNTINENKKIIHTAKDLINSYICNDEANHWTVSLIETISHITHEKYITQEHADSLIKEVNFYKKTLYNIRKACQEYLEDKWEYMNILPQNMHHLAIDPPSYDVHGHAMSGRPTYIHTGLELTLNMLHNQLRQIYGNTQES